jgi:hypothetical protein
MRHVVYTALLPFLGSLRAEFSRVCVGYLSGAMSLCGTF